MVEYGQRRLLLWLTLLSLAFGYIEASVVVYLRVIFYPGGFRFPLVPLPTHLLWIEVGREAATLLLLFSLACLLSRDKLRRFAIFAYCFGLWDLAYYLFLKLILDWPASLLTWDILFLIPLPWTGPVLAPMLVAIALMAAAVFILRLPEGASSPFRPIDWAVEGVAGGVILASFLWNVPALASQAQPHDYPWWLFSAGFIGGSGWFIWRYTRRQPSLHPGPSVPQD